MSRARVAVVALFVVAAACGPPAQAPTVDPAWTADALGQWVDPFLGTHGDGNTFPGALVPWGMVAPSPHTRRPSPLDFISAGTLAAAGYVDDDPQLHGFGLTHLSGVGCPDLGAPVVAITSGPLATDFDSYGVARTDEKAWPGYYSAELTEAKVRAEASASTRAAAFRFFLRGDNANVIVDASRSLSWASGTARVHLTSNGEVEGESPTGEFCVQPNRQTVYFVARFDRPAAEAGTFSDDVPNSNPDASGTAGAWFTFHASGGRTVELQVGISYVSIDGARANLNQELAGRRFDDVRVAAQKSWEDALGRVRVDGGTPDQRTIFYTALYHALVHPSVASDVDGSHRRFRSSAIDQDPAHVRYHVFSLWDTYRTLHPLLTLLYPDQQREMVRSLAEMTVEGGAPPMWELAGSEVQMMVGDPADIVIADAAVKGVAPESSLLATAWPILQQAALDVTSMPLHRPGNPSYRSLGWVPMEDTNSVWGPASTTLEYAIADFSLGRLATVLGVTPDPALATQATSWKNLIDPDTQLFRPRNMDGSFLQPFDPDAIDGSHAQKRSGGPGYVEGSAWQYGFLAPHAVTAHAQATGGADAYAARLASMVGGDRYVLWNEPDIAFPYLFTQLPGMGAKGDAAIASARERFFLRGHDGLPGNDDSGTLSAWYVFSALGLYPDAPAADDYALGTPLFDRATLTLGGATLILDAPHPSPAHVYLQSADLDGKALTQRLRWSDAIAGGTLHYVLTDAP